MEEASYYLSFTITFVLCLLAIRFFKRKVKSSIWSERKAKNVFSAVSLIIGICGGTLVFHSLVWFFYILGYKSSFGHEVIFVAAMFYNIIIGLVLLVIGRIIIGWKKIYW